MDIDLARSSCSAGGARGSIALLLKKASAMPIRTFHPLEGSDLQPTTSSVVTLDQGK